MHYQQTNSKGKVYFLHHRIQLVGDRKTPISLYYFGSEPKEGGCASIPDGYEVMENSKTGLPILRKKK